MHRKIAGILLSMLLLISLGRTVSAAEQTGSIRITLEEQDGEIALFHVGAPVSGGYRLENSFGGGLIKEEDVYSPRLAQWLVESADEGRYRILDADGSAEFSGLEEGLYLLTQTETEAGFYPIQPFLVTIPYRNEWHSQANPKVEPLTPEIPRTGQSPLPFLGLAGMILSGCGLVMSASKIRKKG